jgi:nitrite reductase (NADH) small subunit
MSSVNATEKSNSKEQKSIVQNVCLQSDLVANSGITALVDGQQIALFYITKPEPKVYAIGNYDPFSKTNILSRGIVCEINGRLSVASPMYKQHFDLTTGECLEDSNISVPVFTVNIVAKHVQLGMNDS